MTREGSVSSQDIRAIQVEELPQEPFPEVHQAFRIYLAEAAFDHETGRGTAEDTHEIGGVLVGSVCRD